MSVINISSSMLCRLRKSTRLNCMVFGVFSQVSRSRASYGKKSHFRKEASFLDKFHDENPKKSLQYEYVKEDPLHEDIEAAIEKDKETKILEKLQAVNKKMTESKRRKVAKLSSVFSTNEGINYEKLKHESSELGKIIMEARSKRSRNIVLEGKRLVRDALIAGASASHIFFTDNKIIEELPQELIQDTKLFRIPAKDMKIWSGTVTPAGIIGVFAKPQAGEVIASGETLMPITVIFDNLRDPGNAGTLIRTAAAIGCQRILCTTGCVNLWDGKVLRSAMGGHFSVPIYTGLAWSEVESYMSSNTKIFLADCRRPEVIQEDFLEGKTGDNLDFQSSDESESDQEEVFDLREKELLQRKRERKIQIQEQQREQEALDFHSVELPVLEYSDVELDLQTDDSGDLEEEVALVLGGETVGLSAQAKKIAFKHFGSYVYVPMNSTVDSLNTAIAGSIVLYDLRQKIIKSQSKSKIKQTV